MPLEAAHTIAGQVVDQKGAPISGAWVSVDDKSNTRTYDENTQQTDKEGRFKFCQFADGKYRLSIHKGFKEVHPLVTTDTSAIYKL